MEFVGKDINRGGVLLFNIRRNVRTYVTGRLAAKLFEYFLERESIRSQPFFKNSAAGTAGSFSIGKGEGKSKRRNAEREVKAMDENKCAVRHRGTDRAKVIQVIETVSLKGSGTDNDPIRAVKQFWSFDGTLLAESDHFIDEEGEPYDERYYS